MPVINAFLARDYARCFQQGGQLVQHGLFNFQLIQVVMISLQRLGESRMAEAIADAIMINTPPPLWQQAVYDLTLGRTRLEEVMSLSTEEEQLCKAYFYAGARCMTLGDTEEATNYFRKTLSFQSDCLERMMVQVEAPELAHADPFIRLRLEFGRLQHLINDDWNAEDGHQIAVEICRQAAMAPGVGIKSLNGMMKVLCERMSPREVTNVLQTAYSERPKDFVSGLLLVGSTLESAGDFSGAAEAATEAVSMLPVAFGYPSEDDALLLDHAAGIFHRVGDVSAAIETLGQALTIRTDLYGRRDKRTADFINNLGVLCMEAGELERARMLLSEAEELRRELVGKTELEYIATVHNLADLCVRQDDVAAAARLARDAAALAQESVPTSDPFYYICVAQLVLVEILAHNYSAAIPPALHALEIVDGTAGEEGLGYLLLARLVCAYEGVGEASAAETRHKELLSRLRMTGGPPPHVKVETLKDIAKEMSRFGRVRRAADLLRETTEAWAEIGGTTDISYFRCLMDASHAYIKSGDLDQALATAARLATESRSALGATHEVHLMGLQAVAKINAELGKFDAARQAVDEAVSRTREGLGDQCETYIYALHAKGELYAKIGEVPNAVETLTEALDLAQRTLSPDNPLTTSIADKLAHAYTDAGRYREALETYELALRLHPRSAESRLGPDMADTLEGMAQLCCCLRDFRQAISLARQALARITGNHVIKEGEPLPVSKLASRVLCTLGMALIAAGECDEGLFALYNAKEASRQASGEESPEYASILDQYASAWLMAIGPLYQKEVILEMSPDSPSSQELLRPGVNPGVSTEIINLSSTAWRIREKVYGKNHPATAESMRKLAMVMVWFANWGGGSSGTAIMSLKEGLPVVKRIYGTDHPDYAAQLSHLAFAQAVGWHPSRWKVAAPLFLEAMDVTNRVVGRVLSVASDRQRWIYLKEMRSGFDHFMQFVSQAWPECAIPPRLVMDNVLRRKGLDADAAHVMREAVTGERLANLRPQLEHLTAVRNQLARLVLEGAARETIDRIETQRERLETEILRQVPESELVTRLSNTNCDEVARALPSGSALVEFVRFQVSGFLLPSEDWFIEESQRRKGIHKLANTQWGPPEFPRAIYKAFVLHSNRPDEVAYIDLGDAERIDSMIAHFRIAVSSPPERRASRDLGEVDDAEATCNADVGNSLRRTLFDPIRSSLGDCHAVLLAPDGELCRLPFEILPDGDDRRLCDNFQISYLASGRELLRSGRATNVVCSSPVVVADPAFLLAADAIVPHVSLPSTQSRDFDRGRYQFSPLQGTRAEGEAVARFLGVMPTTGADALESTIKAIHSPSVLHIATHGFFLENRARDAEPSADELRLTPTRLTGVLPESPLLRSGLALAGAQNWLDGGPLPAEAEDGLLTAEDAAGLHLVGTEMVVLSACETGLGEVQVGEGVLGLRRAFALAGARSLVMSLWKVPDSQTRDLMIEFYRRLIAGEGRLEALIGARTAVRATHPDPYFWGAFILQGDTGPLAELAHNWNG